MLAQQTYAFHGPRRRLERAAHRARLDRLAERRSPEQPASQAHAAGLARPFTGTPNTGWPAEGGRAARALPEGLEGAPAGLKRLFTALDKLKARKRLRLGSTFHLTEFGYETSPPDPASGISLALQTRYLQQAAYVAWKTKRVAGLSFYQWDDEPTKNLGSGTRRYFGWQTGLRRNNGKPKPVLSTMPAPFVIDQAKGSRSGLLWGQVRVDALAAITIQVKQRGAAEFSDLTTLTTAADGTWSRRITLTSRAQYRYRWTPRPNALNPSPFPRFSGVVDLGKPESSRVQGVAGVLMRCGGSRRQRRRQRSSRRRRPPRSRRSASARATRASVLVDAIGTAHIAFDSGAGTTYCRLPRKARACDVRRSCHWTGRRRRSSASEPTAC